MDRKIERSKWKNKWLYYGVGLLVLLIMGFFSWQSILKKEYRLPMDKVTIQEVKSGNFQDVILIDGLVEPITSVLVNTPEGGTVEEIFSEDGVMVTKGTPLVRLNNPTLMLSYMTQETAIVEQINNLRNLKLSLEKDQRALAESLIDMEYELTRQQRAFRTDTFLLVRGEIAINDYHSTNDNYQYRMSKRDFLEANVIEIQSNNRDQISRINRSIEMMERNLDIIRSNMDQLMVRAPVSGMLSSFDPVIGESYSGRKTIAKIDVMEGFKVMGYVDEYYLSSVRPGLAAVFSFGGGNVSLVVKKVLPEVVDGKFGIQLVFAGEVPAAIANGQSLQIRLELSAATTATLIPRGNFYQTSGGRFVFVVDGDNAYKRPIRIGRQNPSFYEVKEGLLPGERIITSSYDAFKDFETIKLSQ